MSDSVYQLSFTDFWSNTSGSYTGKLTADYSLNTLYGSVTVTSPSGGHTFDLAPEGASLFPVISPDGSSSEYLVTISDSSSSQSITLQWHGENPTQFIYAQYSPSTNLGSSYEQNGAVTSTDAACFCPGTLILTECGEYPVEALAIGDRLATVDGGLRVIRWIGRRSYAGEFVAGNHLMLPVCIKAGALAAGRPRRDLHVSPGHALFLDGQLVPAWRLVNGASIVQAEAVESVTYYHVDLSCHDVILAEGAPAESFLDDGCRGRFQNASAFDRLYPNAPTMTAMAPRLEDGFGLYALQARIAARAGFVAPVAPIGALCGFVDVATPGRVTGWAQDANSPQEAVALEIVVGGSPVLCLLANAYRGDLRAAGLGSGCHAFDMALPPGLVGRVEVRRVSDRAELAHTFAASALDARRVA